MLFFILFVVALAEAEVNLGDLPMQNPDLLEGDIIGIDSPEERNAIPSDSMRWPGGIVPYVIDGSLLMSKGLIEESMKNYQENTCIKFVPRQFQSNYIRMFAGDGCYSMVGMTGGQQPLSLGRGCLFKGTIVHELGHAIGFYHEHNRSDRDDHLIIYWNNVESGMESQFTKLLAHQNRMFTPFDTNSIMLYGETAFSRDGRSITMKAKSGVRLMETYDKNGLSQSDIIRVKKLYNC